MARAVNAVMRKWAAMCSSVDAGDDAKSALALLRVVGTETGKTRAIVCTNDSTAVVLYTSCRGRKVHTCSSFRLHTYTHELRGVCACV
jgi:DNA-binding LacI/PurR family transcriptional regulator